MKIHHDLTTVGTIHQPVITIGSFDGVHLGHCEILRQLVDVAKQKNGESVVISFYPHPRHVLQPSAEHVKLLNTPEEKAKQLEQAGIDHLVIVPFTTAFAEVSGTEYVESFLIQHFHPHTLIVGHDHQFGNNRTGNYSLLEQYAEKGIFQLIEISPKLLKDVTISSTQIRHRLLNGEIEVANALLGYHYTFIGQVVHGSQTGRKIGFPTANIKISYTHKLTPGNGVYAVLVNWQGHKYKGMMNLGARPTFDDQKSTIEVNIFDFNADLYGELLSIECVARIRDIEKFSGIEPLVEQLQLDKKTALGLLSCFI
jgi:riboflavin kinase/FMN adenylyltransferase